MLALLALLVSVVLGILTWLNHRRANKTTAAKVAAEVQQAAVDVQHTVLDDYLKLDQHVAEIVDEKLKPLRAELDATKERMSRRDSAFGRLLRAIAAQWRGAEGGPDLDPADIAEVEDTIPAAWIRGTGGPKRP